MSFFARFLVLALVLLVSRSAFAQDVTVPQTANRPDAPPYGLRGAYPVGAHSLNAADGAPLDLTMWYPALYAEDASLTEVGISYDYTIKMDMLQGLSGTVAGRAIADADFDRTAAPYPLIILSPGFGLGRTAYGLGEHLASHGMVVVAVEHDERVDETLSTFWRGAVERPRDIVAVLDYAEAQAQNGALAGLIDMKNIAVIGHSYGGYTALALAGAQIDIAGMTTFCEAAGAEGDPGAWLCGLVLPYIDQMAALVRNDAPMDSLWESWSDPRIDAVVPMAGDAYFFGEAGLASVTVPVLALGGTADTGTPYTWGTAPTYDHVSSTRRARVGFENAEHMIFSTSCDDFALFTQIGFYAFCSDAVWDMARAHDLIAHFTTAFLLTDDPAAAATLAPDAVTFTGIVYDAQGY